MRQGGTLSGSLRTPVENSQIPRHAQGDAHGDLLLIAQGKHEVGPKEEFRPGELDFVPWDAQRRMADAERKQNRYIERIPRGRQDRIAF
jgi:hypothetical protein